MVYLYNKWGSSTWVFQKFNDEIYIVRLGFLNSVRLVFSRDYQFKRGFYGKIEGLSLEELLVRFPHAYSLSIAREIVIKPSFWGVTKVLIQLPSATLEMVSTNDASDFEQVILLSRHAALLRIEQ
jgi:hypothetical protein